MSKPSNFSSRIPLFAPLGTRFWSLNCLMSSGWTYIFIDNTKSCTRMVNALVSHPRVRSHHPMVEQKSITNKNQIRINWLMFHWAVFSVFSRQRIWNLSLSPPCNAPKEPMQWSRRMARWPWERRRFAPANSPSIDFWLVEGGGVV